jgi:hypothetical protein
MRLNGLRLGTLKALFRKKKDIKNSKYLLLRLLNRVLVSSFSMLPDSFGGYVLNTLILLLFRDISLIQPQL